MKRPKFSIIIPFYDKPHLRRFLSDFEKYFRSLNFSNFEVLIVSDKKLPPIRGAKTIYTSKRETGPAEKRDLALRFAKGEICAFIDDDAYPDKNWLRNALNYFQDKRIGAVGGPGLTPPEDPFWQKAGGFVYESICCSGKAQFRFYPGRKRFVRDWPGYNLLIRKDVLKKIRGWDSKFYGGEDTKVCLAIIKAGYKILYAPDVIIYHHRRPLFLAHLRQIKNVAIHRGYFVKAYPETSFSLFYFIPTILTLGFFSLLALSLFSKGMRLIFITSFSLFFLAAFLSVLRRAGVMKALVAAVGVILTHTTYGAFFIYGLAQTKLER